jgi:hypothetical protein
MVQARRHLLGVNGSWAASLPGGRWESLRLGGRSRKSSHGDNGKESGAQLERRKPG